ncbi:HpcH/HpaI aldolase/citrate lyase family protein [Aminobacterium mobile]
MKKILHHPRRSMLYMPGNNPNMLQNCAYLGADGVLLDLEDAVDGTCKDEARRLVSSFLKETDFSNVICTVRINGFETPWYRLDLEEIVPCTPDAIRLPKCQGAKDIIEIDKIITEVEKKHGVEIGRTRIHAMLETARGVQRAQEIAEASPRVAALTLGGQDLAADMGVSRTKEGTEILYARSQVVLAAKAAGIDAYDTVFTDIGDNQGLLEETRMIRQMGFTGKAAIHPSQIKIIHKGFQPEQKDIDHALKVVKAAQEAKVKGIGVYKVDGKMVDGPIVRQSIHLLNQAGITIEGVELL